MNDRDEEQARKFAVEWATKSRGKIANLAGCYLQAVAERDELRRDARLDFCVDLMRDESNRCQHADYPAGLCPACGDRERTFMRKTYVASLRALAGELRAGRMPPSPELAADLCEKAANALCPDAAAMKADLAPKPRRLA